LGIAACPALVCAQVLASIAAATELQEGAAPEPEPEPELEPEPQEEEEGGDAAGVRRVQTAAAAAAAGGVVSAAVRERRALEVGESMLHLVLMGESWDSSATLRLCLAEGAAERCGEPEPEGGGRGTLGRCGCRSLGTATQYTALGGWEGSGWELEWKWGWDGGGGGAREEEGAVGALAEGAVAGVGGCRGGVAGWQN
jgi:hypothetical protein